MAPVSSQAPTQLAAHLFPSSTGQGEIEGWQEDQGIKIKIV